MTKPSNLARDEVESWYRRFQTNFCRSIEDLDGRARFRSDVWERLAGGGGDTRILSGPVIEKAAVNVSAVWGPAPPSLREAGHDTFFATGVSIIVHPNNPYAPTLHANLRYFETDVAAWFGGGADLTPWYLFEEDAAHFHSTIRAVCDSHHCANYPAWKQACDDYFYLPHRSEARGVGGIFFDHLDTDLADVWVFQQDLAASLIEAYGPILERRHQTDFGPEQQRWHHHRRGRYVEFNLAWDRGTRFGLETGGRAESILASLPPAVSWQAIPDPAAGTPEAEMLAVLRGPPRAWA